MTRFIHISERSAENLITFAQLLVLLNASIVSMSILLCIYVCTYIRICIYNTYIYTYIYCLYTYQNQSFFGNVHGIRPGRRRCRRRRLHTVSPSRCIYSVILLQSVYIHIYARKRKRDIYITRIPHRTCLLSKIYVATINVNIATILVIVIKTLNRTRKKYLWGNRNDITRYTSGQYENISIVKYRAICSAGEY